MTQAAAPARSSSRLVSLGRLVRVSLFPTAVADVLAGLLVAGAGTFPGARATLALVAASLLVYHAGLALNDWADREHDARTRPERPIPAGELSPRAVLAGVVVADVAAVLLAASVAPRAGAWVAGIAIAAAAYDLVGRGRTLGPALLALCRAMNLSVGLVLATAAGGPPAAAWALPVLYGAYVFVVSRLGRLEDGEDEDLAGGRPTRLLRGAAALLLLPVLVPVPSAGLLDRGAALALLIAGAAGLLQRAATTETWTRGLVGASMGLALRRLLLFTAASALLGGTWTAWLTAALLLALGYPTARALARRFPPS